MNKVIDFLVNNNGLTQAEAKSIYKDAFEAIMRDPVNSDYPVFYDIGVVTHASEFDKIA